MVTELKEKNKGEGMGTMGSWTAVRVAPNIKGEGNAPKHTLK